MYKGQVTTTTSLQGSFRCPCSLCSGGQPPVENPLGVAPATPTPPADDEGAGHTQMRIPIRRIPRLAVAC
jgi:hypothetical protein